MPNMGDWPFNEDGSDTPGLEGVQEDLSYASREYLNDLNGTEFDNHLQRWNLELADPRLLIP